MLAEHDVQVDVLTDDVQAIDLQRVEALHVVVDPVVDLAPAGDRVLLVEEAGIDDLLPIVLFAQSGFGGHGGGAVEAERPREAPGVLLLGAPVHPRLHRQAVAHDQLRVDALERVQVAVGEDGDLVVDLVNEPAHGVAGEELDLRVVGELVEVAREVEVVVVVGQVVADDVAAGAPHGPAQLGVQRLGGLVGDDANDVALSDAIASAEREVDEHVGVALQHDGGGSVGHENLPGVGRSRPAAYLAPAAAAGPVCDRARIRHSGDGVQLLGAKETDRGTIEVTFGTRDGVHVLEGRVAEIGDLRERMQEASALGTPRPRSPRHAPHVAARGRRRPRRRTFGVGGGGMRVRITRDAEVR